MKPLQLSKDLATSPMNPHVLSGGFGPATTTKLGMSSNDRLSAQSGDLSLEVKLIYELWRESVKRARSHQNSSDGNGFET